MFYRIGEEDYSTAQCYLATTPEKTNYSVSMLPWRHFVEQLLGIAYVSALAAGVLAGVLCSVGNNHIGASHAACAS